MLVLIRKQLMLSSKEELVDLVLDLQKENQHLKKEIEKLQERLNRPAKDSHSWSKAPSSDEKPHSTKKNNGEGKTRDPRLVLKERVAAPEQPISCWYRR